MTGASPAALAIVDPASLRRCNGSSLPRPGKSDFLTILPHRSTSDSMKGRKSSPEKLLPGSIPSLKDFGRGFWGEPKMSFIHRLTAAFRQFGPKRSAQSINCSARGPRCNSGDGLGWVVFGPEVAKQVRKQANNEHKNTTANSHAQLIDEYRRRRDHIVGDGRSRGVEDEVATSAP